MPKQRTLYEYSFDEDAYNKANTSKEWRKFPFDF
jgi:8-oxo-dGTP diphosphatase